MLFKTEFDRDIERFGKMIISERKRPQPELEREDLIPRVVEEVRLKRYFINMKLSFQGDAKRTEMC